MGLRVCLCNVLWALGIAGLGILGLGIVRLGIVGLGIVRLGIVGLGIVGRRPMSTCTCTSSPYLGDNG